MEIRSIRIDLDKDILEINGEPVKRKTALEGNQTNSGKVMKMLKNIQSRNQ